MTPLRQNLIFSSKCVIALKQFACPTDTFATPIMQFAQSLFTFSHTSLGKHQFAHVPSGWQPTTINSFFHRCPWQNIDFQWFSKFYFHIVLLANSHNALTKTKIMQHLVTLLERPFSFVFSYMPLQKQWCSVIQHGMFTCALFWWHAATSEIGAVSRNLICIIASLRKINKHLPSEGKAMLKHIWISKSFWLVNLFGSIDKLSGCHDSMLLYYQILI